MKYTELTPELCRYIVDHRSQEPDDVLSELRAETQALGGISGMQISAEQGTLLSILVGISGARNAIEVGTFTGYSALCIARALPPDGKLICCDRSDEWTSVGRPYWERAGVASKIELRLGDGSETLRQLEDDLRFDFAFIDADKAGYDTYYELLLPKMRDNGVLLFDNMFRNGRVANASLEDAEDIAIDKLNKKLASDPRVECVLLAVADGIMLCRKRGDAV